jgi:lipoic acid synthetase
LSKKKNPLNILQNSSMRRPEWLRIKLGDTKNFSELRTLVKEQRLNTVCESARCPNLGECWNRGTATFMILGNICTRSCTFCNIEVGKPQVYDLQEAERVAESVKALNLKHVVITSVTRDDLSDGGASVFAATIRKIRQKKPGCTVEVLIPDMKGDTEDLDTIFNARPDILNHNLETVERLQKALRVQATYRRSLFVLEYAKQKGFITKTGIMVGCGEEKSEIIQLMEDARNINVDILTIGQYLPPSKQHYAISRYYHPDEFAGLKQTGLEMGFKHVESGPLVRSSYHADAHV